MLNYYNSKVTIELRDLLKMTDENGKPFDLWDFDYPSFYEGDAKKEFEQKIIDHYIFHQIGVETPARFKHNFKTRIREIMPYYNQLYKSVKLMDEIDDPFGNVDIVETFEQESGNIHVSEGTSSSSGEQGVIKVESRSASEDATRKFSNTPQGSIDNLDNYMSEASVDHRATTEEGNSTDTGTSSAESEVKSQTTDSGTVKHTLTRKGNQGVNTYAHDMNELRQSFINVDMMVIGALRDLFLLIY